MFGKKENKKLTEEERDVLSAVYSLVFALEKELQRRRNSDRQSLNTINAVFRDSYYKIFEKNI